MKVGHILALIALFIGSLRAQKVGFVDSQSLLDRMPEYKAAEQEIERLTQQWQKEIDDIYARVEQLFQQYREQEPLMSPEMKRRKQDEIEAEERKARELQRKRFGPNGDLFKQREEKMKPILDKLQQAIQSVAQEKKFAIVIDRSAGGTVLYGEPTYDLTDAVAAKLGIR
ncbi:MAG: OmpH family outer membrane protein [Bacteroidia bacterium]|nr:OmpH family outer membrane protein [Bacteroidia bacterium]MCX7651666.1 OmpH family outer membrane protein [Bacteroidia bacterium]MDW8417200.1 OmpH family outer membrane protein [Bacteroidia bacterium]